MVPNGPQMTWPSWNWLRKPSPLKFCSSLNVEREVMPILWEYLTGEWQVCQSDHFVAFQNPQSIFIVFMKDTMLGKHQSGIKCWVGSQHTFSIFSAPNAYFNNFRQKIPYFNVSRQKRVSLSLSRLVNSPWLTLAHYGSFWLSLAHSGSL